MIHAGGDLLDHIYEPLTQAASLMPPGVATAVERFVPRETFLSELHHDCLRDRSGIGRCLSIAFPVARRMHGFAM